MGRLLLAFQTFFRVLGNARLAAQIQELNTSPKLGSEPSAPATVKETTLPPAPAKQPKPMQSEAIALLEALQREARFVDFIQEPIDSFSDTQVGAAVREVHRGCKLVLERCFALGPVAEETEGSPITLTPPIPAERYRLIGNAAAQGTVTGTLVHPGWQATKCELPRYQGDSLSAHVIAPAEIEVR